MSLCTCADAPESSLLADAISCTGSHHTFLSFLAGDDKADRIEKLKSCRHLSQHLNYIFLQINEGWNGDNIIIEPRHEISNNMVCAISKGSDQPAHTRSLIRAFASRLNTL